ncbi:MAG: DUF4097 family beta strand repeat-containing protein [bacterium]
MSVHRSEHRIGLEGIEEVSIFNPVGRIDVTGWGESELFLDYTVTLPGDPESSEILVPQVETSGKSLVIQPAKGILVKNQKNATTDLEDREFNFDFEDKDIGLSGFLKKIFSISGSSVWRLRSGTKVSMNIRVPRGVSIKVKNYNGAIMISSMESPVYVRGLNGPISLDSIDGPIDAQTLNGPAMLVKSKSPGVSLRTVNGPIKCYLEGLSGPVEVKTVNGPVRVMLPQNAKAGLSVKTLFGPIKIGGEFSSQNRTSRFVKAVLNSAEYPVTVKTTTGPITVGVTDGSAESDPADNAVAKEKEFVSRIFGSKPHSGESAMPVTQGNEDSLGESEDQPGSLHAQIDRMLAAGKISADEADRLRRAI